MANPGGADPESCCSSVLMVSACVLSGSWLKNGPQHAIYYVGCSQPKIILLVLDDLYGQPSIWLIGATAYDIPLLGGRDVPRLINTASERPRQEIDSQAYVEHRDGTWLLNTPMHVCQQTDCLACFLSQIRNIDYCPWHNSAEYASWHTVSFICVENAVESTIRVVGRVGPFCDQSKSWMYHVVSHDDLSLISSCSGHAAFAANSNSKITWLS